MSELRQNKIILHILVIVLSVTLLFYGDMLLFNLSYLVTVSILLQRAFRIQSKKRWKATLLGTYVLILIFQLTFCKMVIFSDNIGKISSIIAKLIGIALIFIPFYIERFVTMNKYVHFYLPKFNEVKTVSFHDILLAKRKFDTIKSGISGVKNNITYSNIKKIAKEFPNHSSRKYINQNSLSDSYFDMAYKSLEDPYIYIVISNTGSPASDIISVFTRKQFNHASLSFDSELETIISYNGGANVYPPGLNHELIEYFNQKESASIIVYRLKATLEQKQKMIEKVKEINEQGSAYNMMGVILKYSHKPNIMFCSQFVYTMLKHAGLEYFDAKDCSVKPTDLIELDYYRKLEYAYKITFQ
ncbi:MAG: hypothetical protein AB1Z23_06725 [Eubacteriales bacterium]